MTLLSYNLQIPADSVTSNAVIIRLTVYISDGTAEYTTSRGNYKPFSWFRANEYRY